MSPARTPRGPQVRGLVTRQTILRAAGEQFADHGFHGTAMSAVLAMAGVTKGSLYFHFECKEALAEAVISQMVVGWHTVLAEVDGYRLDPLYTALAASDRVVTTMLEDPIARGGTRLLHDPALPSRAASEHWAFGEAALTGQLRQAAASGLLRAGVDPERTARSVIAQITGHSVICDRAPDRPGLWDAVTDMWCVLLPAIATDDWVTA
jgi:AcrR family transcriptional regulator